MNWHTQASLRSPGAGGPVPAPKLVAREAPGLWGEGLVQAPTEPTPVLRVPQACPQETLSLDPQLDVAPPGHALLFTDEEKTQEPRSSESAERGPLPPRAPPEDRLPGGPRLGPKREDSLAEVLAVPGVQREAQWGGLLSPGYQTGFRGDAPLSLA